MTLDGTNTWIIPGPRGTVVIDPGPADPRHLAVIDEHGPIAAVLLTHRHADHSEAVQKLSRRIPVYAASTRLAHEVAPLRNGQLLDIGGVELRVLGTPGHTSDSVCFVYDDAMSGPILFTGDTLLGGRRPSVLSQLDGALDAYLESLESLAAPRFPAGYHGLPGHGPTIADVAEYAQSALEYRLFRLSELRKYLKTGGSREPEAIALARHPDRPERRQAAALMIADELRYLATDPL